MRKIHLAALAAFLLVVCGGCGYRVGSLMHPQIKTVAVAPVQNETVEYNLTAQVRNLLCERFMVDGSLKLVDEKEADWQKALKEENLPWGQFRSLPEQTKAFAEQYQLYGIPAFFLVDSEGRIVFSGSNVSELTEQLSGMN